MFSVAVLVGSLRRESINMKLARALAKLAEPKLEFRFINIGELPLYNDDLWQNPPDTVTALKSAVKACDAVLLVTPEYNRGVPAVLKNAFDWGTRPPGHNVWAGKPGALAGASAGAIGTAVVQSQLRNSLVVLQVNLMGQPEIYFQFKPGVIDGAYEIADETTRVFLSGWVDKFEAWIRRIGSNA